MNSYRVHDLRCEYRSNPLGIDAKQPRLGWKIVSEARNARQQAYQIQVAVNDSNFSKPVWDTGKVDSDQSAQVVYEGVPLQSRTKYDYRVRVWDAEGQVSEWSDPAWWETALLDYREWTAEWMTTELPRTPSLQEPCLYFRRTFQIGKAVQKARIHMTALGLYLLYCNGERATDELFSPGWTSYRHRLQYQTYDITDRLAIGENALGVMLGDGWYKGNLVWRGERNKYGNVSALLFELHIEYADGSQEVITSDRHWRSTTGPILMSELYHGETYDARLELEDWSKPTYNSFLWSGSELISHPKDILIAQENLPVRIVEERKPIAVFVTPAGETVLDMGQNMVGWVHFRIRGARGEHIQLQHAEVLDKAGNFYTGNLRTAKQTVTYIHGGGEASYEPHFTFQGFRYVKVEGWPCELDPQDFTGKVIYTDLEATGRFECSSAMINQLQSNIEWGQKGNFLDVPTDCPQRDERLGWTGDAQVFIRTSAFLMNVAPFFGKWLHDLKSDQRSDGGVPYVIPQVLREEDHSSSAWGDAATVCPWTLYECYADKRILEEQYDIMKAWVSYIRKDGDNEFLWNTGRQLGDWLALDAKENSYMGTTPGDFIATIFYAHSTRLVAQAAEVLGYREEAEGYKRLLERIIHHFRQEFVTPTGRLIAHTQTTYVLALMFDMLEEKDRQRAVESLVNLIHEHQDHLTTGFVGAPYLCHVLSRFGHNELAYRLVLQESYPSWLYSVKQGATTIWEHWDSTKEDGSFWSDDMNSYNHYAYGAIGEWLYRVAAGIDTDAESPGYKHIHIRPQPGTGLEWVKASYQSSYGPIRSEWDKRGGLTSVIVEIPPNTTATVTLPGATADLTTESGMPLGEASGVFGWTDVDGAVRLELGSGEYRFEYH